MKSVLEILRSGGDDFLSEINLFHSPGEQARISIAQKLWDYYIGDADDILEYMISKMGRQFKPETVKQMQLPFRNFVKKIIKRTALAYKIPANRYILEDSENLKYQEILNKSDINVKAKEWNRLSKLMDTVYVQPVWRKDHLEFDIHPPHRITVVESPENYLEPVSVIYQVPEREDKTRYIYWDSARQVLLDAHGQPTKTIPNPYGVLPFVPCRLRETETHFGDGDVQLVELNEEANIMLVSTAYNAVMQSHGQAVSVNMNLDKDKPVRLGPDTIVQAENVRTDGKVAPSFRYEHPNPAIRECLDLIDWMAKTAAIERGLAPNTMATDVKDVSGYSKELDNWELIEEREDDIEYLRLFEKKLFNVMLKVNNYHNSVTLSEKAKWGIDFDPIKIPVSPIDETNIKNWKYDMGLWTPIDDMIDEDESIDANKAMELVKINLERKKELEALGAKSSQADIRQSNRLSKGWDGRTDNTASNSGDGASA